MPADSQIVYTLGLVRLSSGDFPVGRGAISPPFTCRNDELAPKALEHLQTIYKTLDPKARGDFDSFVRTLPARIERMKGSDQPVARNAHRRMRRRLPAYAGSDSCRGVS